MPDQDAARQEFVRAVLAAVPRAVAEGPHAAELAARAGALADAVLAADAHHRAHGVYRDEDVRRVNAAAAAVTELDPGFTMSDVDRPAEEAIDAFFSDASNMLLRATGGRAAHEGTWDGERWRTWNHEIECWPERHVAPAPAARAPYAPLQEVVARADILRVVAGGHSFNESTSTGGVRERRVGTLLSLDCFDGWQRLGPDEAARLGVEGERAGRLVRVQAGKRLRDVGKELWRAGLALPLAGSTDAQSVGGLLASDLHGTGRDHGFLSEQVHEVRLVRADGELVTFTRRDGGWVTDERPARSFRWLPVAGALGMLGVVVEITLEADAAYHLEKTVRFVDRAEAEAGLDELRAAHHHVSFYYPGGIREARAIRLNTWDRTAKQPGWAASLHKIVSEVGDHALASFAPGVIFDMARRDVHTDAVLQAVNRASAPLVLPAPASFARGLFFAHDEIEYAIPLAHYRSCIGEVMELLAREEVQSVVETRFTPDRTQSLIGPGTAGRGAGGAAWIELATALGRYTDARIAQVYEKFDEVLRRHGGRPHLGKKTSVDGSILAGIYGDDWRAFQQLRREWDPGDKFLPRGNLFLAKIFGPRA